MTRRRLARSATIFQAKVSRRWICPASPIAASRSGCSCAAMTMVGLLVGYSLLRCPAERAVAGEFGCRRAVRPDRSTAGERLEIGQAPGLMRRGHDDDVGGEPRSVVCRCPEAIGWCIDRGDDDIVLILQRRASLFPDVAIPSETRAPSLSCTDARSRQRPYRTCPRIRNASTGSHQPPGCSARGDARLVGPDAARVVHLLVGALVERD